MPMDNAGNFLDSSTSLDTTQTWQTIEGNVGLDNTNDYYSFQLSDRSSFNLVLNDLSDNVDVVLFDDNGSEVANSSAAGINNENINQILGIGTYHIQVSQVDDAVTSYSLKIRNNYIPRTFQFNTQAIDGGIKLAGAKVFDADGVDDLKQVDLWLKQQGESWKKFDAVSEFYSNTDGSIGFDYSIGNLEEGQYEVLARATDKFGATSNGWKESFTLSNNRAPSQLDFAFEQINGGIKLKNASVFDADGVADLEKIDFQLNQVGGEAIKIQDVVSFSENQDGSASFEYSINSLEQGSYELKATAYDKAGDSGNVLTTYFDVANVAPTEFKFEVETIEGGVQVTNAQVSDANGILDLERVDFWLKKEGGSWQNIDDAVEFYRNEDDSIGFDYSIDSLKKGEYVLWARTRDRADSYSNIWQQSFTVDNTAPSQLDFAIERINGGIKLKNASVFDRDGVADLEKIDFQLHKVGGEQIDIKNLDALNFSENQDGSIGFEYSVNSLEQGSYELKATAYDKAGDSGNVLTTYFDVANVAPTEFKFELETIEGGVQVTNAKVSDANGILDLERVDFWLKKQGESFQNIGDAVEFYRNEDDSIGFDYSIDSLEPGEYVLWARTRDKADSYSNIWQQSFQVIEQIELQPSPLESDIPPVSQPEPPVSPQPQQDWFDLNIQDAGINTLSRSLFSDNTLGRNDAIAILRNANDDGGVDATEINDLRTIIDNASYLGMQDYVRVLSDKVVNGDVANKSRSISTGHLEELIGKWFLGSDRPEMTRDYYTYEYAQGSLFQNGISHDDITQGYINDCFFLAALGATLVKSTSIIEDMFVDNGDGTFTVRFYNKGVADYVTVDRYLPTQNSKFVYANVGNNVNNADNELWVAIAEKAYAQINESGWINQDNTKSYNGIGNAGYLSDAFSHITGKSSYLGKRLDFNHVVDAFNSGRVVGFGSKSDRTKIESNIVASHAYALVDFNASNNKFTLLNPWKASTFSAKDRILELTWDEIINNFSYWDSTKTNIVST